MISLNPLKSGQWFGQFDFIIKGVFMSLNPLKSGQWFGLHKKIDERSIMKLSQSPQVGAMVRTHCRAISSMTPSLNPLKSGQWFGLGMEHLKSLDTLKYSVSIPSSRGNGSDTLKRATKLL